MRYLRTDIDEESLRSLEFVSNQLELVIDDCYLWKWIVIATHNALQNFMVKALRDSMGYNILHPRMRRKWLKVFQESLEISEEGLEILEEAIERPEEELNSFLGLYEDIQSD